MFIPESWMVLQKRHPESTHLITQKIKEATPTLAGYEVSWSDCPIGLLGNPRIPHVPDLDHRSERLQHWLDHFENIQLIAYHHHRKVKAQVKMKEYFENITNLEEVPLNLMGPDLTLLSQERHEYPSNWLWCDWDLAHLGWIQVQWIYEKKLLLKTEQIGHILYGLRGYQSFLLIKDPDTEQWHHGVDLHLSHYVSDDAFIDSTYKKLRKIYPMELLKLNLLDPYRTSMTGEQDFYSMKHQHSPITHDKILTSRAPPWDYSHKQHSLLSHDYSFSEWIASDKATKFLGNGIRLSLEHRTQVGLNQANLAEILTYTQRINPKKTMP